MAGRGSLQIATACFSTWYGVRFAQNDTVETVHDDLPHSAVDSGFVGQAAEDAFVRRHAKTLVGTEA